MVSYPLLQSQQGENSNLEKKGRNEGRGGSEEEGRELGLGVEEEEHEDRAKRREAVVLGITMPTKPSTRKQEHKRGR